MTIQKYNDDEITLKEFVHRITRISKFICNNWLWLLTSCVLGLILGLVNNYNKPITYTATITYVLSENNINSSASNFGGIASQLGFNLGATSSNAGLFTDSKIIELMKSRFLVEKILLKPIIVNGNITNLADLYIDIFKLREKWKGDPDRENIKFGQQHDLEKISLKHIVLLHEIYTDLTSEKKLSFDSKAKKTSFSVVQVTNENEQFAKIFCETLVDETSKFYLETKTKKTNDNIVNLKRQLDSIRSLFNESVSAFAIASDNIFNSNPALKIKSVAPIKRQVDIQANTALLTTLITNLELSKMNLYNQTPLFQIIDKPIYPLEKNVPTKWKSVVKTITVLLLANIIILISVFIFKEKMK
jgi:hypothetical protein